jgi:hypothetical protein
MLDLWKRQERAYIDAEAERQPPRSRLLLVCISFQRFWSTIVAGAKSRLHSLSAGLAALALLAAPDADKADCGHLVDRHTSEALPAVPMRWAAALSA